MQTGLSIKICGTGSKSSQCQSFTYNAVTKIYNTGPGNWPDSGAWSQIYVNGEPWNPTTLPTIDPQQDGLNGFYNSGKSDTYAREDGQIELHTSCSQPLIPGQVVWASDDQYEGQIEPITDAQGQSVLRSAYSTGIVLLLAPQPDCVVPVPVPPGVQCTPFTCQEQPDDGAEACGVNGDGDAKGEVDLASPDGSDGGVLAPDGCTIDSTTFDGLPVLHAATQVQGRPTSLTFMYTGQHVVEHAQEGWAKSLVKPMRTLTKYATLSAVGKVWRNVPGTVFKRQPVGSVITVSASLLGRKALPNAINIRVGTGKIRVDASGKFPLRLGDQFGSLVLVAFESSQPCSYARCSTAVQPRCAVDDVQSRGGDIGGGGGAPVLPEGSSGADDASASSTAVIATVVVILNVAIIAGLAVFHRRRRSAAIGNIELGSITGSEPAVHAKGGHGTLYL